MPVTHIVQRIILASTGNVPSRMLSTYVLIISLHCLFFTSFSLAQNTSQQVEENIENAKILSAKGEFQAAESLARDAYDYYRSSVGLKSEETIFALNVLATILQDKGSYGEAEKLFRLGLQVLQSTKGKEHIETLTLLNNLGLLLRYQGRYTESEPMLDQAWFGTRKLLGDSAVDTIVSRVNLGFIYDAQGRVAEAEDVYRTELNRLLKLGVDWRNRFALAIENNLAFLLTRLNRHEEARESLERVFEFRREVLTMNHPHTLLSANNLGLNLMSRGKIQEAFELFRKSLDAQTELVGGNRAQRIILLNNLAGSLERLGRFEEATQHFEKALTELSDVLGTEHAHSLAIRNNVAISTLLSPKPNLNRVFSVLNLGLEYAATSTQRELHRAPTDAGRLALLAQSSTYDVALTVATSVSKFADLGARAILLNKGIGGEVDAELRKLLSERPELQADILELRKAEADLSRELRKGGKVTNLRILRDLAAQDVAEKSVDFAQLTELGRITPLLISENLKEGEVFLDFGLYNPIDLKTRLQSTMFNLVLAEYRSGRRVKLHDLGPMQKYSTDIQRLARLNELETLPKCLLEHSADCPTGESKKELLALVEPGSDAVSTVLAAKQRLASAFLSPLSDLSDFSKLIISPDGPLHRINFGLLATRGRHLFETVEIQIIPNGRQILVEAIGKDSPSNSIMMAGAAEYGEVQNETIMCKTRDLRSTNGFCALPYAKLELEAIAHLARARNVHVHGPFHGDNATEAQVKSTAPGNKIIHFATHGAINLAGGKSGLYDVALAFTGANKTLRSNAASSLMSTESLSDDGLLYGFEISNMALHGTELVALSACGTALGGWAASDGFYSLAYAFRLAGAKNVLMSLWDVDDAATAKFMELVYRNWFQNEQEGKDEVPAVGLRRALRSAQLTASRDPEFDQRHWGAFILVEN